MSNGFVSSVQEPERRMTRPATHPGQILKHDVLPAMNVTQEQFADMLQLSRKTVNEILAGKSSITADTAVKLGALFGNSPQFWSNLQSAYDVWEAEQRLEGTLDEIRQFQAQMQDLAER